MPRAKATRAAAPERVITVDQVLDLLAPRGHPEPLTAAELTALRAALRDPALPAGDVELRQAVYTFAETGERHAGILARPGGTETPFDLDADDPDRWALAVFGGGLDAGRAWARLFFCFLEFGPRLVAAAERDAERAGEDRG